MRRGIYVLADDRALDHAIALVNSIRAHDEETPIAFIPGGGPDDRLRRIAADACGVSVLDDPAPFDWLEREIVRTFPPGVLRAPAELRKLACWLGPFEEFLFLDPDLVVFERIADVLDWLSAVDFVCYDDRHGGTAPVFSEALHRRRRLDDKQLGDVFDAGLWGARREAVSRDDLRETYREAAQHPEYFDFARGGAGRPLLNFLVLSRIRLRFNLHQRSPTEPPAWAGTPGLRLDGERLIDPRSGRPLRFLHWAGIPIGPRAPYWEIWKHYRELDPTLPSHEWHAAERAPLVHRLWRRLKR